MLAEPWTTGSTLGLVPGAGHLIPDDAPAALMNEIRAWLTGRSAPGPTLYLQLVGGEHLRISTQDPAAARSLLPAAGKQVGAGKGGERDE
jgi:preprotein translocase subunit SecD